MAVQRSATFYAIFIYIFFCVSLYLRLRPDPSRLRSKTRLVCLRTGLCLLMSSIIALITQYLCFHFIFNFSRRTRPRVIIDHHKIQNKMRPLFCVIVEMTYGYVYMMFPLYMYSYVSVGDVQYMLMSKIKKKDQKHSGCFLMFFSNQKCKWSF